MEILLSNTNFTRCWQSHNQPRKAYDDGMVEWSSYITHFCVRDYPNIRIMTKPQINQGGCCKVLASAESWLTQMKQSCLRLRHWRQMLFGFNTNKCFIVVSFAVDHKSITTIHLMFNDITQIAMPNTLCLSNIIKYEKKEEKKFP